MIYAESEEELYKLLGINKIMNKDKNISRYYFVDNYIIEGHCYTEEEKKHQGDDLNKLVEFAEEMVADTGHTKYIVEVVKVVKPVKKPYEVVVEDA